MENTNSEVIYSTNTGWTGSRNSFVEVGGIFTAYAREPKPFGKFLTIKAIKDCTGYVKKDARRHFREEVNIGEFYRFVVVGLHEKNNHNYFYAVPIRKLRYEESRKFNFIDAETHRTMKIFAETFAKVLVNELRNRSK